MRRNLGGTKTPHLKKKSQGLRREDNGPYLAVVHARPSGGQVCLFLLQRCQAFPSSTSRPRKHEGSCLYDVQPIQPRATQGHLFSITLIKSTLSPPGSRRVRTFSEDRLRRHKEAHGLLLFFFFFLPFPPPVVVHPRRKEAGLSERHRVTSASAFTARPSGLQPSLWSRSLTPS